MTAYETRIAALKNYLDSKAKADDVCTAFHAKVSPFEPAEDCTDAEYDAFEEIEMAADVELGYSLSIGAVARAQSDLVDAFRAELSMTGSPIPREVSNLFAQCDKSAVAMAKVSDYVVRIGDRRLA